MKMKPVPSTILAAATTLLNPYCELSPTQLVDAIKAYGSEENTASQDFKKLLTKSEVCTILKISLPTLNRMLIRGELMYSKIGRAVRILSSEVERVIKDGSQLGTS